MIKTGLQDRTKGLDRSDQSAREVDFEEIPIVDISGLASDDVAERRSVAAKIAEACETVGFLYIANHGVPESVVEHAYDAMARFFALPLEEKLKVDIHRLARHRGYVPIGGLNADPHASGVDRQQGYEIGLELPADDPDYLAGSMMYGPNVWPEEPAEFGPVLYDYFTRVQDLGRRLFRGFALAFDLDEGFFEDKITKPMTQLRAIHYPPQGRVTDAKEIGVGAHTDYECFTILAQSASGLQVLNSAGDWIAAPPIPGTFVINIGDMMQRWSNDRFRSTVHRVINLTGAERYSLAFFFGANYDALIEVLPTCQGPGNPPRYPPTRAGFWTTENIKAAYTYEPAGAASEGGR